LTATATLTVFVDDPPFDDRCLIPHVLPLPRKTAYQRTSPRGTAPAFLEQDINLPIRQSCAFRFQRGVEHGPNPGPP
jgi:hypothetical protein